MFDWLPVVELIQSRIMFSMEFILKVDLVHLFQTLSDLSMIAVSSRA